MVSQGVWDEKSEISLLKLPEVNVCLPNESEESCEIAGFFSLFAPVCLLTYFRSFTFSSAEKCKHLYLYSLPVSVPFYFFNFL